MESKYSERLDEILNKRRDTYSNEIRELEEFVKSLKGKERELEKIYEEKHKVKCFLFLTRNVCLY